MSGSETRDHAYFSIKEIIDILETVAAIFVPVFLKAHGEHHNKTFEAMSDKYLNIKEKAVLTGLSAEILLYFETLLINSFLTDVFEKYMKGEERKMTNEWSKVLKFLEFAARIDNQTLEHMDSMHEIFVQSFGHGKFDFVCHAIITCAKVEELIKKSMMNQAQLN